MFAYRVQADARIRAFSDVSLAVLIDSAITFNYFTKTCIKNQEKNNFCTKRFNFER